MTKSYKRKWLHKGGIIRQRGENYQVEINFNSKRIRATYKIRAEAERFIEQKLTELNNEGLDSLTLSWFPWSIHVKLLRRRAKHIKSP
jgi:hypothetical protein